VAGAQVVRSGGRSESIVCVRERDRARGHFFIS
jgi:hypothetical protein